MCATTMRTERTSALPRTRRRVGRGQLALPSKARFAPSLGWAGCTTVTLWLRNPDFLLTRFLLLRQPCVGSLAFGRDRSSAEPRNQESRRYLDLTMLSGAVSLGAEVPTVPGPRRGVTPG